MQGPLQIAFLSAVAILYCLRAPLLTTGLAPNHAFSTPLLSFLTRFLGFTWWLSTPSYRPLLVLPQPPACTELCFNEHIHTLQAHWHLRVEGRTSLTDCGRALPTFHPLPPPCLPQPAKAWQKPPYCRDGGNMPLGGTARGNIPKGQHGQKEHRKKSTLLT